METAVKNATKAALLSDMELSAFCGQMALILGSGISTAEGISVMLEDSSDQGEKLLLTEMYEEISITGSFSDALEKTGAFPKYMLAMTRIGEETGTLDRVMNGLSQHYEREAALSRSIRSAVTYPLVMVTMMVAVILVLLVKVMPIFNRVFLHLGSEMTGLSRLLMNIGTVISRYSAALTLVFLALVLLLLWCGKTKTGSAFGEKLLRTLGIGKKLRSLTAACRLADGLSLTLGSGLSQDRSLELAATLVEDPETAAKLSACAEQVSVGGDMVETLHAQGLMTGLYGRLALIGGKTGSLDQAMARIAALYQEDVDRRLSNLLAALEPALVIGISLIVGSILLSVMLPLLGIMSGI